jgi:hypothetical protein
MKPSDVAIAFEHVEKHFRCFASSLDCINEALRPIGKLALVATDVGGRAGFAKSSETFSKSTGGVA